MFGRKKEGSIFDDMPGEETAFQKARREAREDARREHDTEKLAGVRHLGGVAGRVEANLTEPVGSRVLRGFAPGEKEKPRAKGFFGAFREFSKRVNGNLEGKGGVLSKDSPLRGDGPMVRKGSALSQLYGGGGSSGGGGLRPKVKKVKVVTYE